jgi:hypothetical protein
MRFAGPTLLAAVVSAAAAAAVASFSASRLADAPVRGRLAGPDPGGSLASAAALVIGLVAFYRLGGSIGAHTTTARAAIICGAIGGALAGLASGSAQAVALADYLGAVLVTYAVPPTFLAVALGAYVTLAACATAAVAAAVTYLGWSRARARSA